MAEFPDDVFRDTLTESLSLASADMVALDFDSDISGAATKDSVGSSMGSIDATYSSYAAGRMLRASPDSLRLQLHRTLAEPAASGSITVSYTISYDDPDQAAASMGDVSDHALYVCLGLVLMPVVISPAVGYAGSV
jgi:hypothetical protein